MSRFSTKQKRLTAIVAGAAIVAIGGSIAYAYWTSTGSGTGSATTGTSTDFTVTSTAPTGGPLSPGGPSETVAFTVTNPGSGSQDLSSVVVTVAGAGGAAWTSVAGCSSADYALGTPTITYGSITGGGSISGTVTVTMNDLTTDQDGCKNATVPLYFVAS